MVKKTAVRSPAQSKNPLTQHELTLIDTWWRACNYLSVGMIYLQDNPLLKEPLRPDHVKHRLLGHWGASPALSFVWAHLNRVIKRDDLDVTPDHILVLKNGGPKGGPGMPEWGMLPIPKKLVKQGVRDMLRISDARMSGTSYGACILHVAPESFVGGPLAFVKTGDEIEVDVPARRIHLHVPDEEIARRRASWTQPVPRYPRGYGALYSEHIGQADEGCDFDFLAPLGTIPEPEIH